MGVAGAAAQPFEPEVTNGEFLCMRDVSDAQQRFIKKRVACVARCTKSFWRGTVPETDCIPPYGGKTLECVTKYRGPDQRLVEAVEACGGRCPECYDPNSDCSETGAAGYRLSVLGGIIDQLVGGLFCEFAVATKAEQACERKTAMDHVKMILAVADCADDCAAGARAGLVAPYTECTPGGTFIDACIAARNTPRIARIDTACAEAIVDPTFCFGGQYPTGAAWANIAAAFTNFFAIETYCHE